MVSKTAYWPINARGEIYEKQDMLFLEIWGRHKLWEWQRHQLRIRTWSWRELLLESTPATDLFETENNELCSVEWESNNYETILHKKWSSVLKYFKQEKDYLLLACS